MQQLEWNKRDPERQYFSNEVYITPRGEHLGVLKNVDKNYFTE